MIPSTMGRPHDGHRKSPGLGAPARQRCQASPSPPKCRDGPPLGGRVAPRSPPPVSAAPLSPASASTHRTFGPLCPTGRQHFAVPHLPLDAYVPQVYVPCSSSPLASFRSLRVGLAPHIPVTLATAGGNPGLTPKGDATVPSI